MDRTKRRIALEIIDNYGFEYSFTHTLYRVAHTYSDGLTAKEQAFLKTRIKAIEDEMAKVQKLRDRLRRSC